MATGQLLAVPEIDYIVYDYLAEITMAILARAKAQDPASGYARDFISDAMAPNLEQIACQKVKIVSNAGGMNPQACAQRLEELIASKGLSLRVACVCGDDILMQLQHCAIIPYDMDEQTKVAALPSNLMSANAYIGAFSVAKALSLGADIVITGRCVDSAATLGVGIFEFGWSPYDIDLLACGSLAGHLLECGTQITGGNFTDWQDTIDPHCDVGYPVVQIHRNGIVQITKPPGSGGHVSRGTVGEQLLYEIGDPTHYELPDVICDFSNVRIAQLKRDKVEVSGAIGKPSGGSLKCCLTYHDGFKGGQVFGYYGPYAQAKAQTFANQVLIRAQSQLSAAKLAEFSETSVEIIGAGSQTGQAVSQASEVAVKIAVRHEQVQGVQMMLREAAGLALSAPPGLCLFSGTRPRPSPCLGVSSVAVAKQDVPITVYCGDTSSDLVHATRRNQAMAVAAAGSSLPAPLLQPVQVHKVPLACLAWVRSGDKGNMANVGVIARNTAWMPYIWHGLDEPTIRSLFAHFDPGRIDRYYLPGPPAMNICLHEILGGKGGTTSLRWDPQGKGYSQVLLIHPISVSRAVWQEVNSRP